VILIALQHVKNFHSFFHSPALQLLKYFLLDLPLMREYNPHPVALLTGVVTSEEKGKSCGDASLESGNRRLLQLSHFALKPKGLASGSRKTFLSDADKNAVALSGK
jgi:hypothetical protein